MSQNFQPGDFLVFQIESGFALLRFLAIDEVNEEMVWHIAAYNDFFPNVESAETAATAFESLTLSISHIALTNRAFESTQVARIANFPLTDDEQISLMIWRNDPDREVFDRSVRLMLGLR